MKGMVFGVFDGLHEGHRHFLSEASDNCDTLVVVVATDKAARALKGRAPRYALTERIEAVREALPGAEVVAGDDETGSWNVLSAHAPDIVILGYDQDALAEELEKRSVPHMYLSAHEPERFKSSILNG